VKSHPTRIYLAVGFLLLGLTAFWQRAAVVPRPSAPLVTAAAATSLAPSAAALPAPAARPRAMAGAPPVAPAAQPTVFSRFDDWTSRYLVAAAGDRAALLVEGRELAAERRAVLTQLIRTDPRAALEAAVPMVVRQQLPAEILGLLEDRVAGRGDLALLGTTPAPGQPVQEATFRVAAINGNEYRAHVFGRRDVPGTVAKTSMNGIALDGHFAVAESPVRVLEPGEIAGNRPVDAICGISGVQTPAGPDTPLNTAAGAGGPTAVEYNGVVHILCGANHLAQTEGQLLAQEESNVSGAGSVDVVGRPAAEWTHGPKKLLVILVDFSDRPGRPTSNGTDGSKVLTDINVANTVSIVQSFYANGSFGQTSLVFAPVTNGDSPDVTPVLRMPQPATYYEANNGTDRSWQLHQDARAAAQALGINVSSYDRVGVAFSNLSYWWAGLGEIGGRNFWANTEFDLRIVAHELGHTYGLMHANTWITSDGNPISSNGSSSEYGDRFDIMGSATDPQGHFSHWNKSILQWIPDTAVLPVTASGTYRVYRFDHPAADLSLPRALKVRRNDQQDYWIGYRRGTTNGNFDNGAYILWGYHNNQQGNLLDMTPGTANNFDDSALAVGATFNDPTAALTIKTVARGGSGADEWLDIQVNTLSNVHWSQTAEYNVGEQDGQAVLRVVRDGDSSSAVTVNYATADGLATAPADYAAQTGVLSWAAGDIADKFISIPVRSDSSWEAGERFTVTLSNPTGAALLGNATATVAILDAGIRDFGWTADFTQRIEKMLLLPDGSFIAVGAFPQVQDNHYVTYTRGSIAKFSSEGRFVPEYAAAGGVNAGDNTVHAVVRQPDGRVVIGGSFLFMQGASHANLARVLDDGSVDPTFTAGTNGVVWAMIAQPDGRLLIAGGFTSVNGIPREYVARLNADGTLDPSFVGPDFDGSNNLWVRSLAVQADGRILAGGTFTFFDGQVLHSGLCRLRPSGALDPSFVVREGAHQVGNPNVLGDVRAIVPQGDGSILIGGTFGAYNGVPRGGLARLTAAGAVDSAFVPTTDGRCNALLPLPDGRLVAGGWFFNANGTAAKNIAIFSANGALDTNTASAGGAAGEVFDLQVAANGRIQFCGDSSNFEYSTEARGVWRMISGLTNLPGSIQLAAASARGSEGGSVTLTVTRSGGSGGAVTVGYDTVPVTAAGSDFQHATGTLTWADGDASPKSVTIALASDSLAEPAETFTLGLGAPVLGAASLGGVLQATITIDDGAPPPAGTWHADDIGNVGATGSSSESGGVVTITGSGADIWDASDAFHFRSQKLTGDGAIIVRVASMGNTHPWAKVGVMFREDLTPGSRHVMAYVTPANRAGLEYRLTPGANAGAGPDVATNMPTWLMLARSGDTFGAYRSDDGNNWISLGTINCDLPDTALVGLAITSHAAGTTLTATVDNVEVIGVQSPPDTPPAAPSHLSTTGVTASTVTLTWTDNSSDETGFSIERGPGVNGTFAVVGTAAANSSAFTDTGLAANTSYTYRVRAQRGSAYSSYTDPVLVTTNSQPPSGWQGLDIGNVGPGGSESIVDQNITVKAGGADIWFGADGFRFVYQAWHGDGEIRTRVASLTNTHAWAKAGVMFRETLAANSRNVAYVLTADNTSGLQVRATPGSDATFTAGAWVNAPYWVRLVRSGDTFTASVSPDGVGWTVQATQTVPMGTDVYVGLATCAHTTTQLTTAAFEYVQIPTAPPPPPPPPPGDWAQTNWGAGSGSFAQPDATSLTVNAIGADIWNQADDGVFLQRAWTGDGEVVARVASLTNTHPWAKAGIMFRANLTATSPNVFVGLTPGVGAAFQARSATAGDSVEAGHSWVPTTPSWLRLTRAGNTFTAAFSIDGTTWTSLGSQTVAMGTTIYLGFAVSSHAAASGTAVFDHIQLPNGPPPPPPPPPGNWTKSTLGVGSGSFSASSDATMSVTATGTDIWGQFDDGLFVQRAWTGDGEMVVRVDSLANTHAWAKAGIMFRENRTATSPNVFLGLTPSVGAAFQVRATSSGNTTEAQHSWIPGVPSWLKLTRSGNTFSAAFSSDGTTWTALGSQVLAMPASVYVGVAVSSHATVATTVTLSNVQLK
jgi:uncharacterized delta-60 repeat protein